MFKIDIEDLMKDVVEDIVLYIPTSATQTTDEYGDSETTFTSINSNAHFEVNELLRAKQSVVGTEKDVESFLIYIPQKIYEDNKKLILKGGYIVRTGDDKRYDLVDTDTEYAQASRAVMIGVYMEADDDTA